MVGADEPEPSLGHIRHGMLPHAVLQWECSNCKLIKLDKHFRKINKENINNVFIVKRSPFYMVEKIYGIILHKKLP